MGLEILAWSNIQRLDDSDLADVETVYIMHDQFRYHEYSIGKYINSPASEYETFIAGPFEVYIRFKDILSLGCFGIPLSTIWENEEDWIDQPFFNLIYFSDSFGYIGAEVSARLYREFTENRDRVIYNIKDLPDYNKNTDNILSFETEFGVVLGLTEFEVSDFIHMYDSLMNIFRIGSDHGIVQFR